MVSRVIPPVRAPNSSRYASRSASAFSLWFRATNAPRETSLAKPAAFIFAGPTEVFNTAPPSRRSLFDAFASFPSYASPLNAARVVSTRKRSASTCSRFFRASSRRIVSSAFPAARRRASYSSSNFDLRSFSDSMRSLIDRASTKRERRCEKSSFFVTNSRLWSKRARLSITERSLRETSVGSFAGRRETANLSASLFAFESLAKRAFSARRAVSFKAKSRSSSARFAATNALRFSFSKSRLTRRCFSERDASARCFSTSASFWANKSFFFSRSDRKRARREVSFDSARFATSARRSRSSATDMSSSKGALVRDAVDITDLCAACFALELKPLGSDSAANARISRTSSAFFANSALRSSARRAAVARRSRVRSEAFFFRSSANTRRASSRPFRFSASTLSFRDLAFSSRASRSAFCLARSASLSPRAFSPFSAFAAAAANRAARASSLDRAISSLVC